MKIKVIGNKRIYVIRITQMDDHVNGIFGHFRDPERRGIRINTHNEALRSS